MHIIPFSRWLLTKDKHEKVGKIYRKMARMNGLPVTDEAINAFKEINVDKEEPVCHLSLFSPHKCICLIIALKNLYLQVYYFLTYSYRL